MIILYHFDMKGIYLGAYRAYLPGYDIDYQDINGKRDIGGDMMDVDLGQYDYIIATPPCNYYSRANYRRDVSEYSLKTKDLLPGILKKLIALGKPFIVENVRNDKQFNKIGLFDLPCFVYYIGRHTYWTNFLMFSDFHQVALTDYKNGKKRYLSSQNLPSKDRQGTIEVNQVIDCWLSWIHSCI